MQLEKTILTNLLKNENYTRKVLPFLKSEYFSVESDRVLYKEIQNFILKYNTPPTRSSLKIEIDALRSLKEDQVKDINHFLDVDLRSDSETPNEQWLIDSTEKFCQEKALYHAIMKSIEIMDKKHGALTTGAIPSILSDALSVSFDPNVGHNYLEDYEERYEYYHEVLEKIPFDLEFFNKITKNGLPKKTLNIALAGTGVGKSLFMCHVAASCLSMGKNVLYITLELAEKEVSKRIDANLMNVTFDDLMAMPKDLYMKKAAALKSKTNGHLIVKEYPTAGASSMHFKALLNELNLKKSFKPDIIFIDYLNICTSSRIKPGNGVNSYTSDIGLEDTSESFGLPATADFMFALISTEELEQLGQLMVKQLKNRYNDPAANKRFVVGIDRAKMKLYDVENSAQMDIVDSGQTSNTPKIPQKQFGNNKDKFKGFKV